MATLPLRIAQDSALHRSLRLLRAAIVLVVIVALPYLVPTFRLTQFTSALVLGIAVVGLNLLSGFGGQISLGHAAFFGLGAYTSAILIQKENVSAPLAFLCGVATCFVLGVIVGLPALRVRGAYLALVTLTVGVIFPNFVSRFEGLTGGSAGMFNIVYQPPDDPYWAGPAGQAVWLYWVTIVAFLLACLVVWNLMRGRIGRAIVALRDNEPAAIVMGVNRTLTRTMLFGVSAGIAGLGGGLYAVTTGVIVPTSFSLLFTIYLLVGMVLGGSGSYWGPVIGGFAIFYIPDWSSDIASGPIAGVIFGVLIIAFVFVMRAGVIGFLKSLVNRVVAVTPHVPTAPRGQSSELVAVLRASRRRADTGADSPPAHVD